MPSEVLAANKEVKILRVRKVLWLLAFPVARKLLRTFC